MNLSRIFKSFVNYSSKFVGNNAGIVSVGIVGSNHQLEQVRHKSIIKRCGYLEHPEMKKKDLRYKTATWHDPKRMNWGDYQKRKFRAVHNLKPYPLWQSKMDYAENLCRLGMPTWTIQEMLDIHPVCIEYIKRKLNGNVKLLYEAKFSNYVNHRSGDC